MKEAVDTFVIEYNVEGIILRINKLFADYLNIEKERITGRHFDQIHKDCSGLTFDEVINQLKTIDDYSIVSTISGGNLAVRVNEIFIPVFAEGEISKVISYSYKI